MLLPLSAWGQSDADCTAIEDRARQIDCYNELGDWLVRKEENSHITLSVMSSDPPDQPSQVRVFLSIGCIGGSTYFSIFANPRLDVSEFKDDVFYMIGNDEPRFWDMQRQREHGTLGFWNSLDSIKAIEQLFDAVLIGIGLFRTAPDSEPIIAAFNIAGLEQQIVPLREACNW